MSNAKRFLSVILAIVMMCSTLVIGANAAYVAYKDGAIIDQYNALDKAVLTTEQYASAAMDELDRMLNKEQLKFTKEDIIVGDIDLTSVDAAFDSVDTIIDGALFSSLKGMLGDLQYLNADAFETPDKGGVRRDTAGKTDLDIFYAVFQFLHDNTDLLVSFVEGELDPGSILGALVDLSEFMDVNKLLKGLLYEFAYGVEGTDEQVAASSVDAMAQTLIDKYVTDGYMDGEEFVEPLVPALKGQTNISTGTMYTFIDNVIKVLYNELLVPLMNSELKSTIQKFCGIVYITDEATGEVTEDRSGLNEYANLLNVDYVVPTYTFTNDTFISQGNNIIKSIFDALINPAVMVWQAGDKTAFKGNLVNVAKQLLVNAGDELFADYIELATEEEIEAMTAEELVIYAVRAIINSSSFGMYVPETDTIHEFAFLALQQVLATDIPELDFSDLDPNSTDSLVIMGINYAIYSVSSELDMGLEYVYTMDGVEAQLKKAMDYAVDNYAGVLNGIKFSETASAWENLNTLLFAIIPSNWLPASANNDLKTFIFNLIETIAALDFEALFELFEYRADSELQKAPKQVIINLVTRVVNIIFPDAFKPATTLDALVTNQALAGTVRAIFDALWNFKANLAKVALPIVCSILDLTNDQEFEFPELTWDPSDANVEGNSIRTAGSVNVKLMVRNGSTGINTGYTDKNGVFHQDQLYTYDVKSVTTNVSGVSTTFSGKIAGGQTAELLFKGGVNKSTPLVVTMTYDVLTEDGSPLTDEPITETIYSYLAYNEQPDDTNPLQAGTSFKIIDGPKYLYANSFDDLEDYAITLQNTTANAATAVPYMTQATNGKFGLVPDNTTEATNDTIKLLQLRTEETAIMQQVEDAPGVANMKLFETTEAYANLTDEQRETLWDDIVEYGMVYNPRTGALTSYPRAQLTVGAKINGSTTVSNAAVVYVYRDYGLPGMLESEMGKHRQASAYATADSTVFAGMSVWEAYNQAMIDASKAVYSCFRNTTFYTIAGKHSLYKPAYDNLSKAIEELDAQVLSAGVASSQALIDKCYPSNPEDLAYYDPAYIHQGVSDYVPYTYYNFRDELRALEDMIYWATTPDEETGEVAVVNELDKAYREHKFELYFGRLIEVDNVVKTHLERELNNPSREIGDKSEYSEESWYNYTVARDFALATLNDDDANPTKVKAAYRNLLEEEKRLVAAGEGGGEVGGDVTFEPVNPDGGDAIPEIIEADGGVTVITGIGNANDGDFAIEDYFACEGCYVNAKPNASGEMSTGAVVEIVNEATGDVIATYTIAVYGDITGDAYADSTDLSSALAISSATMVPDGIVTVAADLNLDGMADSTDFASFLAVASATATVNSMDRVLVIG
ncbi:MAG: hypothetical protein IIU80_08215 [Clostridia bacterium]|nr:hypothetical protein [Clostridia bacterium]